MLKIWFVIFTFFIKILKLLKSFMRNLHVSKNKKIVFLPSVIIYYSCKKFHNIVPWLQVARFSIGLVFDKLNKKYCIIKINFIYQVLCTSCITFGDISSIGCSFGQFPKYFRHYSCGLYYKNITIIIR